MCPNLHRAFVIPYPLFLIACSNVVLIEIEERLSVVKMGSFWLITNTDFRVKPKQRLSRPLYSYLRAKQRYQEKLTAGLPSKNMRKWQSMCILNFRIILFWIKLLCGLAGVNICYNIIYTMPNIVQCQFFGVRPTKVLYLW